MAEGEKVFIVVQSIPACFSDLSLAEEYAAEMCEKKRRDYTIMCVDREAVNIGLVARYLGVRLMAIKEAREDQ